MIVVLPDFLDLAALCIRRVLQVIDANFVVEVNQFIEQGLTVLQLLFLCQQILFSLLEIRFLLAEASKNRVDIVLECIVIVTLLLNHFLLVVQLLEPLLENLSLHLAIGNGRRNSLLVGQHLAVKLVELRVLQIEFVLLPLEFGLLLSDVEQLLLLVLPELPVKHFNRSLKLLEALALLEQFSFLLFLELDILAALLLQLLLLQL